MSGCVTTSAEALRQLGNSQVADSISSQDFDEQEVSLAHGADLVHEYVDRHWRFVTKWFAMTMKESLEPVLRQHVMASCELKQCDLGSKPPRLRDVKVINTRQDNVDGEDNRYNNVMITGQLCHKGDCNVEIKSYVGAVALTKVEIRGTIMVELVQLSDAPPWFSGLRISFPNAPEVELNVETQAALKLDKFIDFKTMVQRIVKQQLHDVIKHYTVQPNYFGLKVSNQLDIFALNHPRPAGVLRLAVLEHQGRETIQEDPPTKSTGSTARPGWRRIFRRSSEKGATDVHAEIYLGATKEKLHLRNVHDFLVMDRFRQNVRLKVFDTGGSCLGIADCRLTDLLSAKAPPAEQDCPGLCIKRVHLKNEEDGRTSGSIQLQAMYRPFSSMDEAKVNQAMERSSEAQRWKFGDIGDPSKANWMLMVELFYAIGLPAVEKGTLHWVSITVHQQGGTDVSQESPTVPASTPMQQGLVWLTKQGMSPELIEAMKAKLSPAEWRHMMLRGEFKVDSEKKQTGQEVDAVWNHAFRFLLDADHTINQAVRGAKVEVTIWRRLPGQEAKQRKSLGSVSFNLRELVSKVDFRDDICKVLVNGPAADVGAKLRLRLQVCPLERAAVPGPSLWRMRTSMRVSQAFQSFRRPTIPLDQKDHSNSNDRTRGSASWS